MATKKEADKIKIEPSTSMGIINSGTVVAEDLPKWAYRRLESWPDLLEACKCLLADLEGCIETLELDEVPEHIKLSIIEGRNAIASAT